MGSLRQQPLSSAPPPSSTPHCRVLPRKTTAARKATTATPFHLPCCPAHGQGSTSWKHPRFGPESSAPSPASSVSKIEAWWPCSRGQGFAFQGELGKISMWARNEIVIKSTHRRTRDSFILMSPGIRRALLDKGGGRPLSRQFSPVFGGTWSCTTITSWVRASFNPWQTMLPIHQLRGHKRSLLQKAKSRSPEVVSGSKNGSFV